MSVLKALILGIIQGLTEFLPVSSSGHIELGKVLLNVQTSENLLFSVLVHGATALSTIIVFRKDLTDLIKGLFEFKYNESWQFSLKILLSMVPVGIVYLFFKDEVEALFTGKVLFVGIMLIITGVLLTFTYFAKNTTRDVSFGRSFIIGIAQAIAIIPGISRSGATISTALITGVDKDKATRFSFLMVLLPIIGAMMLQLKEYFEGVPATDIPEAGISPIALIVGFLSAFIAGLLACTWMIKIVRKGKLIYFAYYCFIIGAIAIIVSIV